MEEPVKAMVRLRPNSVPESKPCIQFKGHTEVQLLTEPPYTQSCDYVAAPLLAQSRFFEVAGQPAGNNLLQGRNSAIIAHGPTGSGKTYTIFGPMPLDVFNGDTKQIGLAPRLLKWLFNRLPKADARSSRHPLTQSLPGGMISPLPARITEEWQRSSSPGGLNSAFNPARRSVDKHNSWLLKMSVVEIYQEGVYDLLQPSAGRLQVKEDISKGVYLEGLSEHGITSAENGIRLLQQALHTCHMAQTKSNRDSSRSHCILMIDLEQHSFQDGDLLTTVKRSKLWMADLAGAEGLPAYQPQDVRSQEGAAINRSLQDFTSLISALKAGEDAPEHSSQLTRLLKWCLGGNSSTTIVATVDPSEDLRSEAQAMLAFAARAKGITNSVSVNTERIGNAEALAFELAKVKRELAVCKSLKQADPIQAVRQQVHVSGHSSPARAAAHAHQRRRELETSLAALQQVNEDNKAIIVRLQQRNADLEGLNQQLQHSTDQHQHNVVLLEATLEQVHEEKAGWEQLCKKKMSELEGMRQRMQDLSGEYAQAKRQLEQQTLGAGPMARQIKLLRPLLRAALEDRTYVATSTDVLSSLPELQNGLDSDKPACNEECTSPASQQTTRQNSISSAAGSGCVSHEDVPDAGRLARSSCSLSSHSFVSSGSRGAMAHSRDASSSCSVAHTSSSHDSLPCTDNTFGNGPRTSSDGEGRSPSGSSQTLKMKPSEQEVAEQRTQELVMDVCSTSHDSPEQTAGASTPPQQDVKSPEALVEQGHATVHVALLSKELSQSKGSVTTDDWESGDTASEVASIESFIGEPGFAEPATSTPSSHAASAARALAQVVMALSSATGHGPAPPTDDVGAMAAALLDLEQSSGQVQVQPASSNSHGVASGVTSGRYQSHQGSGYTSTTDSSVSFNQPAPPFQLADQSVSRGMSWRSNQYNMTPSSAKGSSGHGPDRQDATGHTDAGQDTPQSRLQRTGGAGQQDGPDAVDLGDPNIPFSFLDSARSSSDGSIFSLTMSMTGSMRRSTSASVSRSGTMRRSSTSIMGSQADPSRSSLRSGSVIQRSGSLLQRSGSLSPAAFTALRNSLSRSVSMSAGHPGASPLSRSTLNTGVASSTLTDAATRALAAVYAEVTSKSRCDNAMQDATRPAPASMPPAQPSEGNQHNTPSESGASGCGSTGSISPLRLSLRSLPLMRAPSTARSKTDSGAADEADEDLSSRANTSPGGQHSACGSGRSRSMGGSAHSGGPLRPPTLQRSLTTPPKVPIPMAGAAHGSQVNASPHTPLNQAGSRLESEATCGTAPSAYRATSYRLQRDDQEKNDELVCLAMQHLEQVNAKLQNEVRAISMEVQQLQFQLNSQTADTAAKDERIRDLESWLGRIYYYLKRYQASLSSTAPGNSLLQMMRASTDEYSVLHSLDLASFASPHGSVPENKLQHLLDTLEYKLQGNHQYLADLEENLQKAQSKMMQYDDILKHAEIVTKDDSSLNSEELQQIYLEQKEARDQLVNDLHQELLMKEQHIHELELVIQAFESQVHSSSYIGFPMQHSELVAYEEYQELQEKVRVLEQELWELQAKYTQARDTFAIREQQLMQQQGASAMHTIETLRLQASVSWGTPPTAPVVLQGEHSKYLSTSHSRLQVSQHTKGTWKDKFLAGNQTRGSGRHVRLTHKHARSSLYGVVLKRSRYHTKGQEVQGDEGEISRPTTTVASVHLDSSSSSTVQSASWQTWQPTMHSGNPADGIDLETEVVSGFRED